MTTRKRKWEEGDHAIVTGDVGSANHRFPVGEEVVLLERNGPTWCCEYLDGSDHWWVDEADLAEVVTEEEVQAAIQSIMRTNG